MCESCLKRGLYTPGTQVHHKVKLTPENIGDPAVTLSFDNLELLCEECHRTEHTGQPTRYRIDDDGSVVVLS